MDITKHAKKILCIDDDRMLQLIVKQTLEKSFGTGILQFYRAGTGEEAMRLIPELKPDIILCDIHMPGMNGFEVCQRIRKSRLYCAVILMSAYDAESDNALKSSQVGADAYLAKPIKKGELLFVVNFVLRVGHLHQELQNKNRQLETSLGQLKQFHKKLEKLNRELQGDKKRLGENLGDLMELNRQLEEKNVQISKMVGEVGNRFESTVALLSNIIELHQSAHRGHSERVAEIATFIAEKMGLTEYQIRNIQIAARIHELGIVALPTQEQRREALDEIRARTYSHHPLVGEMLLKGFPGFELIADIIRHLHENVDGSGSPDALYGDRIPLGSRIVSVASYYDHSRVADLELDPAEILTKMSEQAGIVFDETVLGYLGEYIDTRNPAAEGTTQDLPVFSLTEGMVLASDIYSESGINVLRRGTVLTQDMLSRILKFHNVDPIAGTVKVKKN